MNLPNGWELILVLLVVVVVFGSKRLPDSARALGRSMRILKAETKGLRDDDTSASPLATARPAATATPAVSAPVVPAPQPVVEQPVAPVQPAAPYVGQQLFDAQGRPVQVPLNGAQPVAPGPQAVSPQA